MSFQEIGDRFAVGVFEVRRLDDRRGKRYGLQIEIALQVPTDLDLDADLEGGTSKDKPAPYYGATLATELFGVDEQGRRRQRPEVTVLGRQVALLSLFYGEYFKHPTTVLMTAEVIVQRPSDIPTLQQAYGFVSQAFGEVDEKGQMDVATRIKRFTFRVAQRQQQWRARLRLREQTLELARHLADESDMRARRACRFEQRLAALIAELQAEQKVQLEELREQGWLATQTESDEEDEGPAQGAVTLAQQLARECLPPALPAFGRSTFGQLPLDRLPEVSPSGRILSDCVLAPEPK